MKLQKIFHPFLNSTKLVGLQINYFYYSYSFFVICLMRVILTVIADTVS